MSSTRLMHQVSIYDYPEHLNPFYNDDQHRRLRFWRIGSNKKYGGSRRGSFNLGSLKDLLPSSFRKKTSSTLGINKTSESPPQMRRMIDGYDSDVLQFATFDRRFDPSSDGGAFPRSARYRSSLQNMHNTSLSNRNEPIRSTMQFGSRQTHSNNTRYGFNSGSTSTTPRGYYLTPGSSMNSISTNPFDDDDDDISIENHSGPVQGHRRLRKKRRAPLPPIPAPENNIETQADEETVELRINEDVEALKGLEELTRMTAEFQNFVARSSDDIDKKPDVEVKVEKHEGQEDKISASKIEPAQIHIEIKRNVQKDVQEPLQLQRQKEPNSYQISHPREQTPDYIPLPVREKFHVLRIDESDLTEKGKEIKIEADQKAEEKVVQIQLLQTETILKSTIPVKESPMSSEPSNYAKVTPEIKPRTSNQNATSKDIEGHDTGISNVVTHPFISLAEEETKDVSLSEAPKAQKKLSQENFTKDDKVEIEKKLSSQGFIRVHEPIKFYEDIETFIRRKHPQLDEENHNINEAPQPPQRRRSVKDVIESINRNQQLLKCATPKFDERYDGRSQSQKFQSVVKPPVPSKQMALFKLQQQAESEMKINALLADLQDFDKQNPNLERTKKFLYDDINNNDAHSSTTFEKCSVRRDSNNNNNLTTDDLNVRVSREINPVPKPRKLQRESSEK